LKALSAAKDHTIQERGGGRDPGVSLFVAPDIVCFVIM